MGVTMFHQKQTEDAMKEWLAFEKEKIKKEEVDREILDFDIAKEKARIKKLQAAIDDLEEQFKEELDVDLQPDDERDMVQTLERVALKCPNAVLVWAQSEPALKAFESVLTEEKRYREEQVQEIRDYMADFPAQRKQGFLEWAQKLDRKIENSIKKRTREHEEQVAELSGDLNMWVAPF